MDTLWKLWHALAEPSGKRFNRLASMHRNDFIAHWVYTEQIFAHAQPAFKFWQFNTWTSKRVLSQRETISSLTEHMRKQFHRLVSIQGNGFRDGEIFSVKRGLNFMMVYPSSLRKGRLGYGGETHLYYPPR